VTIFEENVTTDNGAEAPRYTCAKCGATFDTQDGVNGHQRAHSSEGTVRATVCRYCGLALGARARRESHERQCQANPDRVSYEFACDICGETFTSKGGRSMHRSKAHGEKSTSPVAVRRRERARQKQKAKQKERGRKAKPSKRVTRTLRIGEDVTRANMLDILAAFIPDGTISITEAARVFEVADAMATLITDLRGSAS